MRFKVFAASLVLGTVLLLTASCLGTDPSKSIKVSARETVKFDNNWKFNRFGETPDGYIEEPANLESATLDDNSWRKLDLPHDWGIETDFMEDQPNNTGKLMFQGIGWYRKSFTINPEDNNKCFSIQFDGIMSQPTVYLNGKYVGEWKYGYSSFALDLTDNINWNGENIIAVRVDNPAESSRWYPGGGIYRHVWLTKTENIHVGHWGTYITTPEITNQKAIVKIETDLENNSDKVQKIKYFHIVKEKTTGKIAAQSLPKTIWVNKGCSITDTIEVEVNKPLLWELDSPEMYAAQTVITVDGTVTDKTQTNFGIRSVVWDADKGLILNGMITKLKGVCNHHDLGPLGAAVNDRALERQVEIMKEMGVNSIRTSHNPPAPQLLDICDRMGILVLDEAFDCWVLKKTKNDYHRHFSEWYERDVTNMVKRDRNHPCVFMWSSGNEIGEQWGRPQDLEVSRDLTELFHKLDPSRLVAAGCNQPNSYKNDFCETVDVYGFNYKPHLYEDFKNLHPQQPVFSSESSSCISSRGEYYFPVSDNKSQGFFNYQVSSYDLYAPNWAMKPDIEFEGQDRYPFIAGEYVWTGFDYLGEPTPYNNDKTLLINYHTEAERKEIEDKLSKMNGSPSRSSYFGIVDLCGFKKDRFYLYQSRWRPDLPMAHILPHWNWAGREGEITPVHVYTSGDEAELFLNGNSLGKKKKAKIGDAQEAKTLPIALSTGKTVAAKTSEDKNPTANAVDGKLNTRWCAANGSADNSLQLDLGEVKDIGSCVIYWEKDSSCYGYDLFASADNSSWQKVAEADFAGAEKFSLHKLSTKARYIQVKFTGLKNGCWASIAELQVFTTSSPEIIDIDYRPEYYRLRWDDVKYEPGELKVIAYKNGKQWAQDIVKTTGDPFALEASADRSELSANGDDLCFITVDIVDKDGNMVPKSDNLVEFSIEGPAEIIATGNGDATNHDCFKNTSRNAYNGKLLAIIRPIKDKAGKIIIKANSTGLNSTEQIIYSK